MIRTPSLRIAHTLFLSALALPSLAVASSPSSSGGNGIPTAPGGSSAPSVAPTPTETLTAIGNGITLNAHSAMVVGHHQTLSGSAGRSGTEVVIERQVGSGWSTVASATTAPGGSFSASWSPKSVGPVTLRAELASGSEVTPGLTTTVYRASIATYYGPGLWGHRTACGAKLTRSTLGVANRNLPCGTKVSLYYNGKTMLVPVIDRGPYANHANWDLTQATAFALGMYQTEWIGAVAVWSSAP